jgi:hypothetical protein
MIFLKNLLKTMEVTYVHFTDEKIDPILPGRLPNHKHALAMSQ